MAGGEVRAGPPAALAAAPLPRTGEEPATLAETPLDRAVRALALRAASAGAVTAEEVGAALVAAEVPPEQLDVALRALAAAGIEVTEDEPDPHPALDLEAGPSSDPVRLYLREIGRVPLLTAAQEVDLATRIEAGLFAAEKVETCTDPALRADLLLIAADGVQAKAPAGRGEPAARRVDRQALRRAGACRSSTSCRRATSA